MSAIALGAQSLTFGEISGSVSGEASRPIPDAEVRVRDRNSGAVRWLLTARDGSYRFAVLPAGRYDVTVEALGYRPVVHVDVAVAASHVVELEVTLRAATLPVTTVDTIRVGSLATQPGQWLLERGYADLMGETRIASDLRFLSSTADEQGVEGLPWRFTEALVDGARSGGLASPLGTGAEAAMLAFPVRGVSNADVGGLGFDVEVGGSGTGIRLSTRRAGGFSSSATAVEGGTASLGGAFTAGGPLQGDTALAVVGVDYQRSEISRPTALGDDPVFPAALVSAAQTAWLTDIGAYAEASDRVTERVGGFGRLDWNPGDRLAVSLRGSGSRLVSTGVREMRGPLSAMGADHEALSAQASANIYGRLTRRIAHEFRFAIDLAGVSARADALPLTTFAGSGLSIGGPAAFDEGRSSPSGTGMFHLDLGAHQVKTGFAVATHMFDARHVAGSAGEYRFGDVDDFIAGLGSWRRVEGAAPVGEFRMSETTFFLQDAWRVAEGFSMTLGARFDGTRMPAGEIERNVEWLGLTGVDNRDVDRNRTRMSPRLGFRWELGGRREWLIEGGIGTFQHLPDPRDMAEALTLDRGARVRHGVGSLGSWPAAPSLAAAPDAGRTITLLGPDFEGPRTQRLALGLTRRLGTWSSSVAGVYRHTDFLTRRRDLNLTASAMGRDQHGRPLYGSLEQEGTLLAAAPGSNRRFSGFDAADVLESTGASDFWSVTVGLERVREQGLSLATSYTFSRTNDDVVGLLSGARRSPFPDGLDGGDWDNGRSDLDVPHRLMMATEWSAGSTGAVRIGALYRLASGLPFTPGVRTGVDANGDGDGSNDPAFIDPAMGGMGSLLDEWSCLRGVVGFSERNACRGEWTHRLDLRASFRITDLSIGRIDLVLDALDVIATESGPIDHALLLVDRTGSVSTDPLSGVTSVPYVVNPDFGRVLADRSPGILWRAGLRIVP